MAKKNPFDKEQTTKIPFSELVELIGTSCDYKFCIIDENIDEELMSLAASHGINLKGFKHVIETSGIQHAEKRHGFKSNDRVPLSLEDYLLIPFIIKNRDKVEVSAQTDISHHNTVLKYTKQIGDTYYYVEEIRKQSVIAGGNILSAAPYVLIIHWFFIPCPRPTACKITTFPQTRKGMEKILLQRIVIICLFYTNYR